MRGPVVSSVRFRLQNRVTNPRRWRRTRPPESELNACTLRNYHAKVPKCSAMGRTNRYLTNDPRKTGRATHSFEFCLVMPSALAAPRSGKLPVYICLYSARRRRPELPKNTNQTPTAFSWEHDHGYRRWLADGLEPRGAGNGCCTQDMHTL